jgi:hypothetical protein
LPWGCLTFDLAVGLGSGLKQGCERILCNISVKTWRFRHDVGSWEFFL